MNNLKGLEVWFITGSQHLYGAEALQGIMIKGYGWKDIAQDVYILLGFSLAFLILNIFALKKVRRL